jgi:membrane protease YdiL (CAAX protease family)
MLFCALSTLALVAALVLLSIVQQMMTTPLLQEAVGAAGRVAIGAVAFLGLVKCGWRSWIAAAPSQTSWRLMLVPLVYVLLLYPLLFTGTYRMPSESGLLLAMVAANGFAAGVMEELVFRGLVLGALLLSWGVSRRGLWRALVISGVLFSAPHGLNVLTGADPVMTVAQLIWALLLGMVFGALVIAGGSLWPVAVLHGATNAFIHANRYGRDPATDLSTALLLALAPVPLLGYSWWLLGRFRQLRPRPLAR